MGSSFCFEADWSVTRVLTLSVRGGRWEEGQRRQKLALSATCGRGRGSGEDEEQEGY